MLKPAITGIPIRLGQTWTSGLKDHEYGVLSKKFASNASKWRLLNGFASFDLLSHEKNF